MPLNANHALLSAVGDEMADIRTGVDDLSGLVSDLISHCPADLRAEVLPRAQAFDVLIQRLDGLGGLLAALGAGVEAEAALEALTLSDLSRRLSGGFSHHAASAASGDLMLFD